MHFNDYHIAYKKLISLGNIVPRPAAFGNKSKKELEESLKNLKKFLKLLGNPEKKMNFVHVTGTSGKGSVVTMVRQILSENGYKTASYTSPHTTCYLERFNINEKLVDPKILTSSINEVIKIYEKFLKQQNQALSFFELSVAVALYTFAKEKVDWCVLEVGCGGRYDATNVIPTPKAAIITNIDKDHVELLGNSLTKIAHEKAGIIKKGGLVFSGEKRPACRRIIRKEAQKQNAKIYFINEEFNLTNNLGAHQRQNAALAAAACRSLGIDDIIINNALQTFHLPPCRFETIDTQPLIIIDGAHSPVKVASTAKLIAEKNLKPYIVFGCVANKDAKKMLAHLIPVAKKIILTRFDVLVRKAANPFVLEKLVPPTKHGGTFLDWRDALQQAKKMAKKSENIVITGSLFLAGDVRSHWIAPDEILKYRSSFGKK